jgi:hypothetical protein
MQQAPTLFLSLPSDSPWPPAHCLPKTEAAVCRTFSSFSSAAADAQSIVVLRGSVSPAAVVARRSAGKDLSITAASANAAFPAAAAAAAASPILIVKLESGQHVQASPNPAIKGT